MSAFWPRALSAARFALGNVEGPFLPEEVIFEVTTSCNLACPMCVRTAPLAGAHAAAGAGEGPASATERAVGRAAAISLRSARSLNLDDFRSLLNRVPTQVGRVAFAGLGEPLLNRALPDMVDMASARGHGTVLYTNGTLLDEETSMRLLSAGLAGIVIPLDGGTKETYERYRVNASFEQTVGNIYSLLAVRKRLRSRVFVELQMLRLPGTEREVAKWRRTWGEAGVDSLRYKPDHMGVYQAPVQGLDSAGARPRTEGRGLDSAGGRPGMEGWGLDSAGARPGTEGRGVCPMPWRGPATVDVDGNVYPCCVQSPENALLGKLPGTDLAAAWNGAEAVDLRTRFVRGRRKLETCKGCLIPLFPVAMSAAASLLDPFAMRRVLSMIERVMPSAGSMEWRGAK